MSLLLGVGVSTWVLQTPAPRADTGPLGRFPGLRARGTLERLIGSGEPHPIGSRGNDEVRARLVESLEEAGLAPEIQSRLVCGSFRRYCGTVHNVVARIDGRGPGAILLNSHYDTQPATPGAADPMAGVAVLVEVARMLADAPAPERSVIFLFNDGEEAGLLGSTAFVDHHRWAADVQAVVNLDARGTGGPSFPAYTIGDDRVVLAPFVAARGRVPAGSALRAIAAMLPNTNDLAVFDRLRIPGVLFGFARHLRHYHSSRDDLAHLDPGSLQQQGDQTLAVARALAGGGDLRSAGHLSFVSVGPLVLRWPERGSGVVAVLLVAGFVLAVAGLRRREEVSLRPILWGAAVWPLAIVVTFFGCALVNLLRKAATPLPLVWVSRPGPTILGFGAAAAMWLFASVLLVRRRAGGWGLWAGTLGWWSAIALAVGWLFPGFGYLFSVPVGAAGAAVGLRYLAPETLRDRPAVVLAVWALPAVVTLAVWLPHLSLVLDLIGLGNMPPVAALAAVALTPAGPLLLACRRPWLWPAAFLLLATVLLGIGARSPAFSADQPQWGNLLYVEEAGAEGADWVYTGWPVPAELQQAGFGDETVDPLPWSSMESGARLPAPASLLPPPELETLEDGTDAAGRRHVRARAISRRGAPVLQLVFEDASAPGEVRIDGAEVPPDRAGRPLFRPGYQVTTIWTMPPEGVEIDLVFPDGAPRVLWLADRSYDLPPQGRALLQARPETAAPVASGDGTILTARLTL